MTRPSASNLTQKDPKDLQKPSRTSLNSILPYLPTTMKSPLDIDAEQLEDNFEFIVDLCHANLQPFRIKHKGKYLMLVPIFEKPTIDPDIVDQVEEFKKEWMANLEDSTSSI